MISKQDLITLATKEFATTLKVISAYPDGKDDFKPHERSSDALKLVSTFVFEMYLTDKHLFGAETSPTKFKDYKPGEVKVAREDFKVEVDHMLEKLSDMPDEDMTTTVEFAGKSYTKAGFLHMMIHDQIHHRGQLSVYIRMAGGTVPSIYGPSADDPSTNL